MTENDLVRAAAETPYLACAPLTSEPFKDAIDTMDCFGDVERILAEGDNPLTWDKPAGDLLRLLEAARDELTADLADVLRAANAGTGEADLTRLARAAVNRRRGRDVARLEPPTAGDTLDPVA
jgi:hypothetical protein